MNNLRYDVITVAANIKQLDISKLTSYETHKQVLHYVMYMVNVQIQVANIKSVLRNSIS